MKLFLIALITNLGVLAVAALLIWMKHPWMGFLLALFGVYSIETKKADSNA
jgi:hypothetical protein